MSGPYEQHHPPEGTPPWTARGAEARAGDLQSGPDPQQAPAWTASGAAGDQPGSTPGAGSSTSSPWANIAAGYPPQPPALYGPPAPHGPYGPTGWYAPPPQQSPRRRSAPLLVGLTVLLLVAAGIVAVLVATRSGHRATPAQALRAGVDRALATSTVSLRQDLQLSDGVGGSAHLTAHGRLDLVHDRVESVLSSGTTGAQVISDGHTVWTSSTAPAFTAQLPAGATWAAAPLTQLRAAGVVRRAADSLAALYLTRGAGPVRADGPDTVNGIAAHRYSFPVDLHRAYCATGPSERPAVQRAFHVDGSATVDGQAWIDRRGRAVKVLVTATGAGNGLRLRSEEDLTGFNTPVQITPPPANQTTPITPALTAALRTTSNQPPASCS